MNRKLFVSLVVIILSINASAQLKYQDGRVLIGNANPIGSYPIVVAGGGMYFNHTNGRFLQIEVMNQSACRIAGHQDMIVFYNTATGHFNGIEVDEVYNMSDAKFKNNVKEFNCGLDVISRLRPVSYNFINKNYKNQTFNEYTKENQEIGLIAQELEKVLPNLVYTDDEGNKSVNYISLIPVLIDAIQSLKEEVELLKKGQ